ncbi:MAG: methylmalonyl-CoA mutase family protein [Fimbriimonas sp.]|nr:methylmalonyl-CoA mutase family protein [Fimbriimonas sp.]
MSEALFGEFAPVSTEDWLKVVEKDLKGADFEKRLVTETLDGIRFRPFYRADEVPPSADTVVRGYLQHAVRPTFREEIRETELGTANKHALRALGRGAGELAVLTYPIGVPIRACEDIWVFTQGIWIDAVPIHWLSGPFTRPMLALVTGEAKRREIDAGKLQGSVEFDPITDRCAAWTPGPVSGWQEDFQSGLDALAAVPNFNTVTIRGSLIEKSGASIAQELACSLGIFTEYLAVANERFVASEMADFVRRAEIRMGVGTNYFLEIAKLRALKLLVENVLATFGIQGVRPKFHSITTSTNKTLFDPFNNLLRATVEAMASTVGGVDSLSVAAYDQGYGAPEEFSEHLTRNTEALLLEEAYMGRVADPLGGSYAVEKLTQEYADKAWTLFKQMEEMGGFVAAWENGFVPNAIHAVQAKRSKQVGSRRRTIVGTTVYPYPKERRLGDVRPRTVANQVVVPQMSLDELYKLSLDEFETDVPVPSTALDPFRPSWPFEHLRLRVERFGAIGGKRPLILLAEFGNVKMRRARSMFVQGFLGAAGYDMHEAIVAGAEELTAKIAETSPSLVVLCSEDPAYLEFARQLKTNVPVVVAGNPVDSIEDLKAAGVTDFIHLRLDQLETLERYHEKFGVPEIPLDEPLLPEAK